MSSNIKTLKVFEISNPIKWGNLDFILFCLSILNKSFARKAATLNKMSMYFPVLLLIKGQYISNIVEFDYSVVVN